MGARAALCLVVALAACQPPAPAPVLPSVSTDSELSRIERGMGEREVREILGDPNDVHQYTTPKVAIPFYFGRDAIEIVYRYRNLGRVVFAMGPAEPRPFVIRVEDDPSEPGYFRYGYRGERRYPPRDEYPPPRGYPPPDDYGPRDEDLPPDDPYR